MATKQDVRYAWEDGYEAGVLAAVLLRDRASGDLHEAASNPNLKRAVRLIRQTGVKASDLDSPSPKVAA